MNRSLLAAAIADDTISPLEFLTYLKLAFRSGDDRQVDLACSGFMLKCTCIVSESEWQIFEPGLVNAFPDNALVHCLARLGKLFLSNPSSESDVERKELIVRMIQNFPSNACHQEPPISEMPDAYFNEGENAWNKVLSENPEDTAVIKNACVYFFRRDRAKCERLYRLGFQIDDNEWWQQRLRKLEEFHSRKSSEKGRRVPKGQA